MDEKKRTAKKKIVGAGVGNSGSKRAEAAPRGSEEFFRSLVECSSDAIFCVDEKGQYKFTNHLFASTFGKSPDYFIGKTFWDIYPKEHADYRFAATKRVFQTGESESLEVEVPLPDRTLFFYATANPIKDETGKVILSLTHAVDITERKRAEAALKESGERYQRITEGLTDYLYTVRLQDGQVVGTMHGQACKEVTGYTKKEFADNPNLWMNMVVAEERDMVREHVQRILAGENIPPIEHRIVRKDGQIRWVSDTPILQFDSQSRLVSYDGVIKDITTHKQAEEALRESEAQLRAILDATPFPIALVDDQDDKVNFWSRSAHTLFGHTAPTAAEWYQIAYPDPDYRQQVIDRWKPFLEKARLSGQTVNTGEYQVTCHNGSVRICELYATFLKDKLMITFNDITERKKEEEALGKSDARYRLLSEH